MIGPTRFGQFVERVYNRLRVALSLVKKDTSAQITTFLMADAVLAAKSQQKTPEGYYNVERTLRQVLSSNGTVRLCGSCMDARGINDSELMEVAPAPWTNLQAQPQTPTRCWS